MRLAVPARRAAIKAGLVVGVALTLAIGSATAVSTVASAGGAGAVASPTGHRWAVRRACGIASRAGRAACQVLVRTDVTQRSRARLGADQAPTGVGYGPSDLQSAYDLPSSSAGSGQTVAVVDAYDDPRAEADLAAYRTDWGLPACTAASGCFQKVNQDGQPSPLPTPALRTDDPGWATETSLDLDMVSAVCPNCHILLVEADTPTFDDLGTAVDAAVGLGAKFVSNSYGGDEYLGAEGNIDPVETDYDSYYNHPGVVITAAGGDTGYDGGASYPAASPYVTAVGGTSLTPAANSRGWRETVWNYSYSSRTGAEGTGSGCSLYEGKPPWQHDPGCSTRTANDVAAVADPATGVAVYDSYDQNGYLEVGGTSASAPIIAAVYALAGTPAAGSYPASYPYAHTSSLNDVTDGINGSDEIDFCQPATYLCAAGTGYDGPTGWGTPDGTAAFTAGGATGTDDALVSLPDPGDQTSTVGAPASLLLPGTDWPARQDLTYHATGLPAGLSIATAGTTFGPATTGRVSGTPTSPGTYEVTITATGATGATGSVSLTWTVQPASTSNGSGCTADQLLGNPGFENGASRLAPWTAPADQQRVVFSQSDLVDAAPHSGLSYAAFDIYSTPQTQTLAQTVTIPAGCTTAQLSFWLRPDNGVDTSLVVNTFQVQILDSNGQPAATLAQYSNLDASTALGAYTQHSVSLNSFIGRTITVTLTGTLTASSPGEDLENNNTLDDDNALSIS
jgi:putative Ig domain-containing protein